MQNKGALIITFLVCTLILFALYTVDEWSSDISKKGYITTGTGISGAELYTGAVAEIKPRMEYGGNAEIPEIEVPGAVALPKTDVENTAQKHVSKAGLKTFAAPNHASSGSFALSNENNWLATPANTTADFNAVLKARTTEVKKTATEPTKTKPESKNNNTKKQNGKMGEPGEPGAEGGGASLPIGDGTWMLMIMAAGYGIKKKILVRVL